MVILGSEGFGQNHSRYKNFIAKRMIRENKRTIQGPDRVYNPCSRTMSSPIELGTHYLSTGPYTAVGVPIPGEEIHPALEAIWGYFGKDLSNFKTF
jgi:hypothetical protein